MEKVETIGKTNIFRFISSTYIHIFSALQRKKTVKVNLVAQTVVTLYKSRLSGISWSPSAASLPELPETQCSAQTCAGSRPLSPPEPTDCSPQRLSKWLSPNK